MKGPLDFERASPFRRPDWRHERVISMIKRADGKSGRSTKRDDEFIKALRLFVLRFEAYEGQARTQLGYENPGLFWAYQIFSRREDDGYRKGVMIESRLLANQTDEEIADDLCTIPEVIHWYEAIFFNVRDRLRSHDWIVDHVLMPAFDRTRAAPKKLSKQQEDKAVKDAVQIITPQPAIAEPFFDCTTKFFAYFGGPFLLDYVITGFRNNRLQGPDDIGGWFDAHYINRIRHRSSMASQTFEVNRYNVMQLFEIHNQLISIERSSESQTQIKDALHVGIKAMLTGMKWAVGREVEQELKGTKMEKYETGAGELRDDEIQQATAGRVPDTMKELETLVLPPPKPKTAVEEPTP